MKKLYPLFVALAFVLSCSTDETDPVIPTSPETGGPETEQPEEQPGSFSLSAETTDVVAFQMVSLSSSNQTFSEQTYDANFGDAEVTLTKNGKGDLAFLIPNVEKGDYQLKLLIDEKEGSVKFKVGATTVSDVNAVLETSLKAPLREMEGIVEDLKSGEGLSAEAAKLLNSAAIMASDFNGKQDGLSSEQKIELGRFFKAHPIFSDHFSVAEKTAQRAQEQGDSHCFSENANYLSQAAGLLTDWKELSEVINGTQAKGYEASGAAATIGAYLAAGIVMASQEQLVTSCKRPVSHLLQDEDGKKSDFEMTSGSTKEFELKTGLRGLTSTDAEDTNPVVATAAISVNSAIGEWNGIQEPLNAVTAQSDSWFNTWLSRSAPFPAVPGNLPALPASAEESFITGNSEYVSISGLPAGVTAVLEKLAEGVLKIKLNAAEGILPIDINGEVVYDDGNYHTESEFKGRLIDPKHGYKLEIGYKHLDQSITIEKTISPGDALTMPNNTSRYVRINLEGKPIYETINRVDGWTLTNFGDSNSENTEDVFIKDYEIREGDYTDPDNVKDVRFKFDLILSNQGYRYLLENEYEISEYIYGQLRNGPYKIVHKADGTWERTDLQSGAVGTGPYDFSFGNISQHEEQCHDSVFKAKVVGVIRNGGYGIHAAPNYMYILEDGSLRVNVFPYGCPQPEYGWLVKKK